MAGLITVAKSGVLADPRISILKAMGWIPKEGTQSAALIKTYVTSPLQDAIAKAHGNKVINTLTGFKWIGEKLRIYEEQLKESYELSTGSRWFTMPWIRRSGHPFCKSTALSMYLGARELRLLAYGCSAR